MTVVEHMVWFPCHVYCTRDSIVNESPNASGRLFAPAFKKDGSGIGLALVKRFADNFGGSVSVESTPGEGATFYLRLPLVTTVQVLQPQAAAPMIQSIAPKSA